MARHSFWVIVDGSVPTSFRSREREDLVPTLTQLKRTQPNVELKWFERGKLWTGPGEARDALIARRQSPPPGRPRDWRPGGDHKDPRAKYALSRDEKRARYKARHGGGRGRREDFDAGGSGTPRNAPPLGDWPKRDRPRGDRPYGDRPRGDRPHGDRPDRPWRPKKPWVGARDTRPRGDRPHSDRPWRPKKPWEGSRDNRPNNRPRGDRPGGDWRGKDRPRDDRPRDDRPDRPWRPKKPWEDGSSNRSPDERKPRRPWGGNRPWRPNKPRGPKR